MTMPEDSITLFKSHFDAIQMLPTEDEQLTMYKAVFNHQFYGLEPDFSDKLLFLQDAAGTARQ